MRTLLRLLAFWLTLTLSHTAFACDSSLASYARECALQDRFRQVRQGFRGLGLDMNEVAEYKALRFIARTDWEKAVAAGNFNPAVIYQPAPLVWNRWLLGEARARNLRADLLDNQTLAELNGEAMTSETISTLASLKGTEAGHVRGAYQLPPGFTFECSDMPGSLFLKLQQNGYDLKNEDGRGLIQVVYANRCGRTGYYRGAVMYARGGDVGRTLNAWFKSLHRELARPTTSPVATLAYYQRWLVAIHPFGDGNGRTSRFVQDILARHFDLPLVPAGDLQNDVLTAPEAYIAQTLGALEKQVALLETCLEQHRSGTPVRGRCEVISW